jgi:hypothetical protein
MSLIGHGAEGEQAFRQAARLSGLDEEEISALLRPVSTNSDVLALGRAAARVRRRSAGETRRFG